MTLKSSRHPPSNNSLKPAPKSYAFGFLPLRSGAA